VVDGQKWVCTKKTCTAFQKYVAGKRDPIDSNLTHNHPADLPTRLIRQQVANACKRKAADDLFQRPSKLMRSEISSEALQLLTENDRAQIRK
jgi:hypothetical protein